MKYIRKFNKMNESHNYDYDYVYELISDFIDEKILSISFTSYFDEAGDYHVEQLKNYLKNYNISLDIFMKENLEKILQDSLFTECCGFMDYLIYTYDKNFPLSGQKCGDDLYELEIKYEYGYQNYDLGRKYLLQSFDTVADFFIKLIEYTIKDEGITDDFYKIVKKDNNTVFLFIVESKQPKNLKIKQKVEISDNIIILIFSAEPVNTNDIFDKYENSELIEDLEVKSSAATYNI